MNGPAGEFSETLKIPGCLGYAKSPALYGFKRVAIGPKNAAAAASLSLQLRKDGAKLAQEAENGAFGIFEVQGAERIWVGKFVPRLEWGNLPVELYDKDIHAQLFFHESTKIRFDKGDYQIAVQWYTSEEVEALLATIDKKGEGVAEAVAELAEAKDRLYKIYKPGTVDLVNSCGLRLVGKGLLTHTLGLPVPERTPIRPAAIAAELVREEGRRWTFSKRFLEIALQACTPRNIST